MDSGRFCMKINMNKIIFFAILIVIVVTLLFLFVGKDDISTTFGIQENVENTETEIATRSIPDGATLYENKHFGFSLLYPEELQVKEFDEKNGSWTIVFEDAVMQKGFQIFTLPYYEEEITMERIQMDVQGGGIKEPKEALIGDDGNVRALIFWSDGSILGETREVWFIHDGLLYEVTAPAELDVWLAEIMKTWRFGDPQP